MKKAGSSREVSKWETLNRDLLGLIFKKLDVMDITMGASRVCVSWFLASHDKTLWNTIDLANFQQKGLKNILSEITRLSGTVPKNLFFGFYSCVQEIDLIFAAERMKNIEKLVLPVWRYQTENPFRFAFSQWKNLKTLIIAHNTYLTGIKLELQEVGKNCSNLTNFKYSGTLYEHYAEEIVEHLQGLKRLSLRCSFVTIPAVLLLITGLQNLTVLNLSHCKELDWYPKPVHNNNLVLAASQKLEEFIICSDNDCKICKDEPDIVEMGPFYEKNWRNDEIKELEF